MNGGTPHNLDAGGAHLLDRARDVPGLQLDTAAAVLDEESPETQPPRTQRGELHAVVGGETEHVGLGRSASLEVVAQARRLALAVVEEPAVAVDARVGPFAEDRLHAVHLQLRRKRSARRPLHAVVRPEDLLKTAQLDEVAGLAAGMAGREASVACGMPVLRRDHQIEPGLQLVRDRHDLVSAANSHGTSREEVVLDVDENQGSHLLHYAPDAAPLQPSEQPRRIDRQPGCRPTRHARDSGDDHACGVTFPGGALMAGMSRTKRIGSALLGAAFLLTTATSTALAAEKAETQGSATQQAPPKKHSKLKGAVVGGAGGAVVGGKKGAALGAAGGALYQHRKNKKEAKQQQKSQQ